MVINHHPHLFVCIMHSIVSCVSNIEDHKQFVSTDQLKHIIYVYLPEIIDRTNNMFIFVNVCLIYVQNVMNIYRYYTSLYSTGYLYKLGILVTTQNVSTNVEELFHCYSKQCQTKYIQQVQLLSIQWLSLTIDIIM